MKSTPISKQIVDKHLALNKISNVGNASIRQIAKLVRDVETETQETYVKMEMGVPGLPPAEVGVKAEIAALQNGVASIYPMIEGLPQLKKEISRFSKLFMDVEVSPESCIPTVGSMQGAFATFLTACRRDNRDTLLFLDPGFPVQKQQMQVLGLKHTSFDVYDFRGAKLEEKLEEFCSQGQINTLLYSNPNNPSWICFTEDELQTIAKVANKYDIIVIEDLAYFAMDFRKNYSVPGVAPFQPTIAKYYNKYVQLISSSKVFSYAGQRISSLIISDDLFTQEFDALLPFFNQKEFGKAIVYGALYALSSGTSHSSQYALAALLEAVNNGTYNFVADVKTYGERAGKMKKLFVENGFSIVYDTDIDAEIADGFYFTISYAGFSGAELAHELLYYGISAITLDITGSTRTEGLRACTSQINNKQIELLEERLKAFNNDH